MDKIKTMFVGEKKFHSNKKNQDYHVLEVIMPSRTRSDTGELIPAQAVQYFIDINSRMADGLVFGDIVALNIDYDPVAKRETLLGMERVQESMYGAEDFK